ncbi:hypothetical protein SteCoe_36513 [Stentor coeruleus]|uniref:Uncharacterized protein n=1 Tax=Stentor coeruleus TaxID=5963 RepID=A0A1R2AQB4_9CILI|nr:hypothetical protein SteCoe_36513 [Stentor coeruleus]
MNKISNLRQTSVKSLKPLIEQLSFSPYSKPAIRNKSSKPPLGPITSHKNTRNCTHFYERMANSPNLALESDSEHPMSKSYDTTNQNHGDSSFESQETVSFSATGENFMKILDDKLKDVGYKDFSGKINVYFTILDMVITAESRFSEVLYKIKKGLIESFKCRYKIKIENYKKEAVDNRSVIESLKNENKNYIAKLRDLSSQNIELITANETLKNKYTCFESSIKQCKEYKGNPNVLMEELMIKSEKIRELTLKLDELYRNENKIMQIVDKLKEQGIEFDKLYQETPVRKPLVKKLRKNIPIINLGDLPRIKLDNTIM